MNMLLPHADWIGIVLSLSAYFMLARHRRAALVVLVLSNVVWGSWALTKGVTTISLLNAAYLVLNLRTLVIWRTEQPHLPQAQ
jgi:hypothetical protein